MTNTPTTDTVFAVQVSLTDRTRTSDGRFRTFFTNVDVLAANADQAQMVAAIRDGVAMVIATNIVI